MEEVYNFIRKEIGLSVGDTIVVGVSGGPDSMALLYILNEFKNKMDLNISPEYLLSINCLENNPFLFYDFYF